MFKVEDSGFLIPVDGEIMDSLCRRCFSTPEEIQNDVEIGDVEFPENIIGATADYSDGDELIGEYGIWYIRCDEDNENRLDFGAIVEEITGNNPADYFYSYFSIELEQ